MGLDDAMDILKGKAPADRPAKIEAALVVALTLVEMYQSDVLSVGPGWRAFCQGTAYKRYHELLDEYRRER